ncbi:MAG: group II truncated hemoglobin [Polyangiales bacterium]
MAPEAADEKSPYELLGGDDGVRKLTADFYELMDTLPEAATIRAMHKGDLSMITDKLGTFLIGWLGGPQHYQKRFGRVIIPLAHKPFPIGPAERDQWLLCMHRALEKTSLDGSMKARLMDSFGRMAEMCRTKD